jgi:CHAT domain-containing protein
MRCAIARYLVAGTLAWLSASATAQQNPLRQTQISDADRQQFASQRDQLFNQAVQLAAQEKQMSAIKAARAALEIQQQHLGTATEEACTLLEHIAMWQERRADFAGAIVFWNELLPLSEKVRGREHWSNRSLRLIADSCRYAAKLSDADRQKLAEAARLNFQSEQFFAAGKFAEARNLALKSLEARTALLGPNDPITAASLHNVGSAQLALGDFQAARPVLEKCAVDREQFFGVKNPATLNTMRNLNFLYSRTEELKLAGPLLEKLGEGSLAIYGPKHPISIECLFLRGNHFLELDQLAEAEPMLSLALQLQQMHFGNNSAEVAQTRWRLGMLCIKKKDYSQANEQLQTSLKIYKAVAGEDDPATARAHLSLGVLKRITKDYNEAIESFQTAIDIFTRRLGETHAETVDAMHTLAVVLPFTGEETKAERLYKRVLKLYEQTAGENDSRTGLVLAHLGVLYTGWGDFGTAETHLKRALEIYRRSLGEEHADTAGVMTMLAQVDAGLGRFEEAEKRFEKALEITQRLLGPNHMQTRGILLNVGNLYTMQEKYDEAEKLLQQVLSTRSEKSFDERYENAVILERLASIALLKFDYAEAISRSNQAMEVYRDTLPELNPHWSETLMISGIANLALKRTDEAKRLANRALEVARFQIDSSAMAQAERQQLALSYRLRQILDLHLSLPAEQATADENYRHALLWKGAILAKQIRLRRDRQDAASPLAEELQQVCSRMTTLSLRVPEAPEQKAWLTQIDALKSRKESLEAELAAQGHDFRATQQAAVITPKELQAALPADTVLIDVLKYVAFSGGSSTAAPDEIRFVAFIVRRDRPVVRVDLGPSNPINEAVERWRRDSLFVTDQTKDDATLRLQELFWKPLQPHVAGCTTLLFSPDSELAKMPLGALPGKKAGTYLIEDIAIGVLPVPQMLPEMLATGRPEDRGQTSPTMLMVGDIDYDAAAGDSHETSRASLSKEDFRSSLLAFDRLKAARGEMEAVETLFRQRFSAGKLSLLDNAAATEAAFRREAPQHTCLLVATHGFFAAPNVTAALAVQDELLGLKANTTNHSGTLCGLALAGANQPPVADMDDGILTAHEVAAIDLRNMDLAVLSGCETAVGHSSLGEGAMGLQRAFQVAGAHTTVASLWNVPDKKTSQLMQRFYANMWDRRMSKLEALREAQIWVMHSGGNGERLPPYHWAAFQLSGDWQ